MTEPEGQRSSTTTVLRNGRTVDQSSIVDVTVPDGIIVAIEPSMERTTRPVPGRPTVSDAGQRRAAAEVRDRFRHMVDLELVALTHSPVTGSSGAGNRRALTDAIEAGVDVVGGCPHLEDDPEESMDVFLEVATEAGMGLDLHMDETLDPTVFHLSYLARRVRSHGDGRW